MPSVGDENSPYKDTSVERNESEEGNDDKDKIPVYLRGFRHYNGCIMEYSDKRSLCVHAKRIDTDQKDDNVAKYYNLLLSGRVDVYHSESSRDIIYYYDNHQDTDNGLSYSSEGDEETYPNHREYLDRINGGRKYLYDEDYLYGSVEYSQRHDAMRNHSIASWDSPNNPYIGFTDQSESKYGKEELDMDVDGN